MNGLRQLLRLEDKVAAEGRRLRVLGDPPMRGVAAAVVAVAAILHGAVLLLPATRSMPALPAASPIPDFPLVWRPTPTLAAPQFPVLPLATAAAPAAPQPAEPPAAQRLLAAPSPAAVTAQPTAPPRATRVIVIEPVPEPIPELALNTISSDVEAILPNSDTPPPSLELGPPSGAAPAPSSDAAPNLVERVSPVYPVAARSLRAEGRVRLRLAVLPDGSVGRATVEECSRTGLGFEAAALAAVKRWRYEPAPLQSIPRKVIVTIHFQRQEGRP